MHGCCRFCIAGLANQLIRTLEQIGEPRTLGSKQINIIRVRSTDLHIHGWLLSVDLIDQSI